MTWYGFFVHNAPSLDTPDMTVYAVLGYQSYIFKAGEKGTQTHQLLVVSRPCACRSCTTRRRLTSDAQPFIFSYPMNCNASLLTPNSASEVPQ
jgi:hypothetical protein